MSNPQPSDAELAHASDEHYFAGPEDPKRRDSINALKQATAQGYLDDIRKYRGPHGGRLLSLSRGHSTFSSEATAVGYDVVDLSCRGPGGIHSLAQLKGGEALAGNLGAEALAPGEFEVCVLIDVIEHVRDPMALLKAVHRLLKPGGTLFVTAPSVDSWSARIMKQNWIRWKPEHLSYFNAENIQTALLRSGFNGLVVEPLRKVVTFDYARWHFENFPMPKLQPMIGALGALLPVRLQTRPFRLGAGGMAVFARKAEIPARESLSVIVAAYNEAETFEALVEAVLQKDIPNLDIEVIVVESNSTDGTREIAMKYAQHPRVKLVLEDRPRGKGHAVRSGLAAATGDYILIQDADLEYDLEDYDALIEPLVSGRNAFVLGSRHGGKNVWKMRKFAGQWALSSFLNLGHWIFTTLINVLFLQRLGDPFTMYKVFRRDCLYGLTFECDRFDFDFELLIKLLKKGYKPVEIPVNYRSRSFKEGKKVTMFGDPLSWLRALAWLWFVRVDPLGEVEKSRNMADKQRKPV